MIYPIVVYGDPVLRKKAQEIPQDTTLDLRKLAEDMFETMDNADGIGLAAPQIGLSIRMFVVDGSKFDAEESPEMANFKKVFLNATILKEEGEEEVMEEGCLSIPKVREQVRRYSNITIRYQDLDWVWHEEQYEGMRARVIQHEYDHIEGVLFLDHLTPLRKQLLKGKLGKIVKGDVRTDYRIKVAK